MCRSALSGPVGVFARDQLLCDVEEPAYRLADHVAHCCAVPLGSGLDCCSQLGIDSSRDHIGRCRPHQWPAAPAPGLEFLDVVGLGDLRRQLFDHFIGQKVG